VVIAAVLLAATFLAGAGEATTGPQTEFAARAAALGAADAEGWLKLADFCEQHLLWTERKAALDKVVAFDPENKVARSRLDQAKYKEQWLPIDDAETREAKDKQAEGLVFFQSGWVPAADAQKRLDVLRARVPWSFTMALEGESLIMLSSEEFEFSRKLHCVLENTAKAYRRSHQDVWPLRPLDSKVKVFLFANRNEFKALAGNPPDDAAGGYNPLMGGGKGCLMISRTPKGTVDEMLITAVHELTHALDHRLCGILSMRVPGWIAEGRASYFGHSQLRRQIIPGAICIPPSPSMASMVPNLKNGLQNVPLASLVNLNMQQFNGPRALEHYALAWAWVHFLYHGDSGKYASGFAQFLKGVPAGKFSQADLETAVGQLADLEPRFKLYVENQILPSVEAQVAGSKTLAPELPKPAADAPKDANRENIGWDYARKQQTEHFTLYSGLSEDVTRKVGELSEKQYQAFSREYKEIVGKRTLEAPIVIYLFPGEDAWRRFLSQQFKVLAPRGAASAYNAAVKIGFYYPNHDDETMLLSTIVHENTHALIHQLAGMELNQLKEKPGVWLFEAWSMSMQAGLNKDLDVKPGSVHFPARQDPLLRRPLSDRIEHLAHSPGIPLDKLLDMPGSLFNRGGINTYAEAWAFFHFLRYGNDKYRDRFTAFLKKALTEEFGRTAFEQAVAPLDQVEPLWKAYREKLVRAKKKDEGAFSEYKL
jgi:hypothetical protein